MVKLRNFIKRFKESDYIKIASIMLILILVMVIGILESCIAYYEYLSEPYEINCSFSDYSSVSEKMADSDGIIAYSRTITKDISVNNQMIRVECVNADYLNRCYGIRSDSNNTIWLNNKAFELLSSDNINTNKEPEVMIDGSKKQILLMRLSNLRNDEPYAVRVCGEGELKNSDIKKVCLKKDGTSAETAYLSRAGLFPINSEIMVEADYEQKLLISDIKYSVLVIAVSSICLFLSIRLYRIKFRMR